LVAWKTGVTPHNADTMVTVARRLDEFPLCADGLREGRLSLDQVGVIAEHAADGSDAHYAELAAVATVAQLRTAVKLEPRPEPEPPADPEPEAEPEPKRSFRKEVHDDYTTYQIVLPRLEAAKLDAGMQSHHDAQIAAWKRDHEDAESVSEQAPPFPNAVDAFMGLVEAGWDADVAARPHGQHTTVVVHVDLDRDGEKPVAALHLGPVLSEAERRYLTCDATCEVWFERHGQPIGAGRSARTVNRRLRRALEHRDRCCAVPGCGATRGLHAHHIRHWEDGGATELDNMVLLCRITIGCTTRGAPAPRINSGSPTPPVGNSTLVRWRVHRPHRHPMSRPIAGRPANAPTGGGTPPSNQSHHRRRTRQVRRGSARAVCHTASR
jgi:hypothetical protein